MTAVNFLMEEIMNGTMTLREAYNQALEMEKQQIIEAHGDKLKISSGTTSFEYWLTGEDYYKKQFNK
jgi:hypothetical protein